MFPWNSSIKRHSALTLFLLSALAVVACSKGNGPTGPPGPPNPYSYGVGCPGVGGIPVNPDGSAFTASLINMQMGDFGSEDIQLNLFYQSNNSDMYNVRNVVGQGTFNTQTLLQIGNGPTPLGFCVSSVNISPTPGTSNGKLDQSQMPWILTMDMQAQVQVPQNIMMQISGMMGGMGGMGGYGYPGGYGGYGYPGGYGGYPGGGYGGQGYGGQGYSVQQVVAQVAVGTSQCPAYLTPGNLSCSPPPPYNRYYQSQQQCPCIQASIMVINGSGQGQVIGNAYYTTQQF